MSQSIEIRSVVASRGHVAPCPTCEALFEWRPENSVAECPYCDAVLMRVPVVAAEAA